MESGWQQIILFERVLLTYITFYNLKGVQILFLSYKSFLNIVKLFKSESIFKRLKWIVEHFHKKKFRAGHFKIKFLFSSLTFYFYNQSKG